MAPPPVHSPVQRLGLSRQRSCCPEANPPRICLPLPPSTPTPLRPLRLTWRRPGSDQQVLESRSSTPPPLSEITGMTLGDGSVAFFACFTRVVFSKHSHRHLPLAPSGYRLWRPLHRCRGFLLLLLLLLLPLLSFLHVLRLPVIGFRSEKQSCVSPPQCFDSTHWPNLAATCTNVHITDSV